MNLDDNSTADIEPQYNKEQTAASATAPVVANGQNQQPQVVKIDATKIMKIDPANLPSEGNAPKALKEAIDKPVRLEPTRYGDWEKNGRCIDF